MEKTQEVVFGVEREQNMGRNCVERREWSVESWSEGVGVEIKAEEIHDREYKIPRNKAQREELLNFRQFCGQQRKCSLQEPK